MPPAIIAVAAVVAGYAATTAAVAAGIVAAGSIAASLIGAVVSMAIGYGLNAALGTNKVKKAAAPADAAEARKQLVRLPTAPRAMIYGGALVSGTMVYAASSGPDQRFLHLVVVLATHPVHQIITVVINDVAIEPGEVDGAGNVTVGKYAGKVRIRRYLGDQTTADPDLVAESPDGWGADHALLGCAYLYVRLEFNRDVFASGLQSIQATVEGKADIYDPRTGTTGYSNNFALCILDYLRSPYGLACADDEVDFDRFASAANASDEGVQINAEGTQFQGRYRIDGVVSLDRTPMDIMEEMLTAGGGTLTYVQGRYQLHPGTFAAPDDTFTISDLAGPIELTTKPPRRELWNAARGTFIDPSRFWQASEFPPLSGTAYEAQDGERIWRELDLPFTTDVIRAQRLARLALRRARESLTVKAPVRYAGIRYTVWQMLSVTVPDFGWTAKPFRVVDWAFDPDKGLVTLTLREESATSYAWLYDQAGLVDTTSDTTLVDPLAIPAPTDLLVVATSVTNADGAAVGALDVSWTGAAHPFVTGHEVQFRVGTAPWQSVMVPGANLTRITPTIAGATYEVRVRGTAGLARGLWASSVNSTAVPDTTPPAAPTGLGATGILRGISLSWSNPPDRDLKHVEIWERAPPVGSPYAKIGESRADFFVRSGLPAAATRVYRVRAVDLSGNLSGWSAEVTGQASLLVVDDIGAGIIGTAALAQEINAPGIGPTNPTTGNFEGRLWTNTTDKKLYRFANGAWTAAVPTVDLTGQLAPTQIEDGAILREKLGVGLGANLIYNSCLSNATSGWTLGTVGATAPIFSTAPDLWDLDGFGSGMVTVTSMTAVGFAYLSWLPRGARVPVIPGRAYEAQARLMPLLFRARLSIVFYDPAGNLLADIPTAYFAPKTGISHGHDLANYDLAWLVAVAPQAGAARPAALGGGTWGASAATARVQIVVDSPGGVLSNPYLFFTQTYFGQGSAAQTQPSPWAPGGISELDGALLTPGSLNGTQISDLAAAKISGQLTAAQLAGIEAAKVTGQIIGTQITDLAVSTPKLAAGAVVAAKIGAGAVEADKIAANAVTAAKIEAGAVTAGKIAAGAVTAEKLTIGSSSNVIWNSRFESGLDGWFFTGPTAPTAYVEAAPDGLTRDGRNLVLASGPLAFPNAMSAIWAPEGDVIRVMAVQAGDRLQASAYLMAFGVTGRVFIQFFDASQNALGAGTNEVIAAPYLANTGGANRAILGNFTRVGTVSTAPAGAAWARMVIDGQGGYGAANTYVFATHVMFGRALPNQTQLDPFILGGVASISGGVVKANTITGDKMLADSIGTRELAAGAVTAIEIAAGAITTEKLSVGSGANAIWNSTLSDSAEGWAASLYGGPTTLAWGSARDPHPNWTLAGYGSGYLNVPGSVGAGQGAYAEWRPYATYGIAALVGRRYGAQALLLPQNCNGRLDLFFIAGDNTTVLGSASSALANPTGAAAGVIDGYYTRAIVTGIAPSGTAYVLFRVTLVGVAGNSNPYLFFSKAGIGEMPVNATDPGPWVAGGVIEMRGGMLKARTVGADKIIAGAITANEMAANSVTAGKIAANAVIAGTVAAGAIGATQIAAGEIKANHLASDTIISQAVQIGTGVIGTAQIGDAIITNAKIANLTVGGEKIAGNATTTLVEGTQYNSLTLNRPGSGYVLQTLTSCFVTPAGDKKVIIVCDPRTGFSVVRPIYPSGGGGDIGSGDGAF